MRFGCMIQSTVTSMIRVLPRWVLAAGLVWLSGGLKAGVEWPVEVLRPSVDREGLDTAPRTNPLASVRTTTRERGGNYQPRNILGKRYNAEAIREAVRMERPYRPYPAAGDAAYGAMPPAEREAILDAAEALLGYGWPTLTLSVFLNHYDTGSNAAYFEAYHARMKALETLVYAEILEGQGRFIEDIANGLWAVCEQTTWAHPAGLNAERPGAGLTMPKDPVLSLSSSEVGALLATADLFFAEQLDAIHPTIRERLGYEVTRHLLEPYVQRTDYWWMAYEKPFTNNWNPWITSNVLFCARVFHGNGPMLEDVVIKAVDLLDRFINVYPDDGGCEEGPVYWKHAPGRLLDCLNLLHEVTGGLIDIYDEPLLREMGNFMWYTHIHDNWYVNFADALARYTPEAGVIYRYGAATNSANLMAFAARFEIKPYLSSSRPESLFMVKLPDLFTRTLVASHEGSFKPETFVALSDLETVYMRQSANTQEGFYLAAKGGYNAESHNHNDVGSFLVFLDGEPLLIDVGVGTYTSKTFSEQRYEIWSMQSSYHNLPDINGQKQPHMLQWRSSLFEAVDNPFGARVEIGLESAYPPAANLASYRRILQLDRDAERIAITERLTFQDAGPIGQGNHLEFHLMTDHIPVPGEEEHSILLLHPETRAARALLRCPPDATIRLTRIELDDQRLIDSWGRTLSRISFAATAPPGQLTADYSFTLGRP